MSQLLSEAQYDKLMRVYQELRLEGRILADNNRRIAYNAIPQLKELDKEIADVSFKSLRREDGLDPSSLKQSIADISRKKEALLTEHGFTSDFLDIKYKCDLCQDTGYIDGKRCHCFRSKIISVIYSDRRWKNMLDEENFDTFDLSYYDDETLEGADELSPRSSAVSALSKAHAFVEACLSSEDGHGANLIITGNTGIGKTFLCNCIAKELIDAGLYVVYLTAPSLFEIFEKVSFGKKNMESLDFSYESLFDCDLLIIDDLGAEFSNSFTNARIFDLLNRRLLGRFPTLISTNLNLQGLKDLYSERFTSRIIGNYTMIHLYGDDIRLKRRMLNNKPA